MTPLLSSRTLLRPSAALALAPQREGMAARRSAQIFSRNSVQSASTSSAARLVQPLEFGRGFGRRAAAGLVASLSYSALHATATSALCDGGDKNSGDDDFIAKIRAVMESQSLPDLSNNEAVNAAATALGSQISAAIASGIPTDISYGFFAGYFSGLALKKIGKVASIALGAGFLALQTLAYHGYVDVHHDKLQREVEAVLDRNNNGVVDAEDLKSALDEVRKVAGFGLEENGKSLAASGGGFGMGFLGGLRSG
ncbi:hypothetical protein ACHAXT_010511 [Thalassiosira profunda]